MTISDKKNFYRWIIIIVSCAIVLLILWYSYIFFQLFKNEERNKMQQWAEAQKTIIYADESTDLALPFKIVSRNTTIPIVLTDQDDNIISMTNVEPEIEDNKQKSVEFLSQIKTENEPIVIGLIAGKFQRLYYGNSSLLNKLKYYPIALLLVIFMFALLVYNFYKTSRIATQNRLWAGMAKETAHQIGTPLSSLIGWIEIMRAENIDQTIVEEIEKDVLRLQTITERFSKIGSEPALEMRDVIQETRDSYDYLQSRASRNVHFSFKAPEHPIMIPLNPVLHSWTIENLVKNAIDAMRGRGDLNVVIEQENHLVKIKVSDSGKGIPKNMFKTIFEPGYTTKKRGWGLGLSLTKRIVEEYHKGKIKVLESEIDKGTTIQVSFKTV